MLILGSVLKTCSSGVDNEGSRCNRQITGRALVRLALRILGRWAGQANDIEWMRGILERVFQETCRRWQVGMGTTSDGSFGGGFR